MTLLTTVISPFEMRVRDLKSRFERSLPERVAEIAETLRQRQRAGEPEDKLRRQFHNLAGTAVTFGFHSIAAAATDGFDECADLGSERINGEARYLWSLLEELTHAASGAFLPSIHAPSSEPAEW
jgi:HPt (histidine-containing phosphotransfer) domain-containing protein